MTTSNGICTVDFEEFLAHKETLLRESLKPGVVIRISLSKSILESNGGAEKVASMIGVNRSTIFRLQNRGILKNDWSLRLNYHKKVKL